MGKREQQSNSGNTTLALADEKPSASLAVPGSSSLQSGPLPGDLLATVDGIEGLEIDDDGLGHVDQEDIRLPLKVFNFKGLLPNGDPIPANVFFDTVTEEVSRELTIIPVKDHKTNEWREYNEAAGKSEIKCSSFDRHTGRMEDGTERYCEGCPDAQWQQMTGKDGKPKRGRHCGPVHNVFAMDAQTFAPLIIRFRRSSLRELQTYLNRHYLKRRPARDSQTGRVKYINYPFYAFKTHVSLKMSDDKKYALPVLERGEPLPADIMRQAQDQLLYVNAVLAERLPKIVQADQSSDDEGGADTSFDTSKMSGGHGKDFVDEPAAES